MTNIPRQNKTARVILIKTLDLDFILELPFCGGIAPKQTEGKQTEGVAEFIAPIGLVNNAQAAKRSCSAVDWLSGVIRVHYPAGRTLRESASDRKTDE